MKAGLAALFLFLMSGAASAEAEDTRPISVCTEPDFWAPYSFMLDGKLAGEYAEMTARAMKAAGERYVMHLQPWKRCLERAADGQFDALLGASFAEDRLKDYRYPADAGRSGKSKGRISQVDYVVLVHKDAPAPAKLTLENLPEPVGVPLGYLAGDTLRAAGKKVAVATKHADLFHMLARGRVSSVIMQRSMAEIYLEREKDADVRMLEPALWSSSHFLIFSREGQVDEARAQRIWDALAAIRQDPAAMKRIEARVGHEVQECLKAPRRCHP